jgi:hypothetical protein
LANNDKLPVSDRPRVQKAIQKYEEWLNRLSLVNGDYQDVVTQMVTITDEYKRSIELDLIFDSQDDFLYRQKGQIKVDNTVLEEFLPILVTKALAQELNNYNTLLFGPTTCFSGIWFESSIKNASLGGGIKIRGKDHDFSISRKIYIQTSYQPDFIEPITLEANLAYISAECKTNLDKTMFQEASATAVDVKTTIPGAKYYLLCEWLDMTPISTSTTAIDEIIILRKAKRVSSDLRSRFNTHQGRVENRDFYSRYLQSHPLSPESFLRFTNHIKNLLEESTEDDALRRGYF